ncbi:MAG: amidohydrolase family protein, partial [Chitinophagales bacterium]|nr:amidohydrolase family protein [Chitinophagales bacterium]
FSRTNENKNVIYEELENAEKEMWQNGIIALGDISNDGYSFKAKSESLMCTHTFIECFGFYPDHAEVYFKKSLELLNQALQQNLSASITPHAPYSVPPELFNLIFSYNVNQPLIYSYHNQESEAENNFFISGSGEFLRVFNHFNVPLSLFEATGKNSLHSVIDYFPPDKKILFVHNTFSGAEDIAVINSQCPKSYFCFCPNANNYIEDRLPDFSLFRNFSDRICIGTDSLASNNHLSVLEEMKTIQAAEHSISTEELLQWATLNGANFFGWNDQLGSIEKGKRPGLNLITDVSPSLQLTPQSGIRKIV